MDAQLWLRIEDLFHAALELPEEQREDFVVAACEGNAEVRREVLAMLDEDQRGATRVSRGVAEVVHQIFADAPASSTFVPPERIGSYERQEFLGKGGMGTVWKYVRVDTGQPMAIKFLFVPPGDPLSELRRKRFAEEIRTLARLRHPHIVSFHDAGVLDDGTPWFVMDYVEEYVRGMHFTAFCCQPRFSIEERLQFFRSACEAVLYAHLQGVIHRDLKPSNILVASDETPRIVDFGIARQMQSSNEVVDVTSPTSRFMSPDYAAPEWKQNGQFNALTDVYSLGVILYELLAGRHPYRTLAQPIALFDEQRTQELPEKPSAVADEAASGSKATLPRSDWNDLDKLCLTAMHPDPNERYKSVESLVRDIDHYLNDEPLEIKSGMTLYRVGKFVRRYRQAVAATAAMLALTVSLVAFFMWRLARERNIALAQAARVQHIQDFMTDLLQGGDQDAGPAVDLPVIAMIDRGVQQAGMLGNEPEVQADLYQTLGSMSQKLGRLDQADSLLVKALERRQSLAGIDPDGLENTRIALALVRADEGKTSEAEHQARQALNEIRIRRDKNKMLLGSAELALGVVMVRAGEHRQAIGALDQAIEDIEDSGGEHSPLLARALGTLADANMYTGNYSAAEELNRKALDIDRAVYGENHPRVGEDLGNLAQAHEIRGYYSQSEPLEREALGIMTRWYGPDHPETARKMTTLASTLLQEKKVDEASDLLGRALSIQERVYGPQHPRVAYVLNSMGLVAQDEKKFAEAERDYLRVADIYRQAYGDGEYRVAVALDNLASVYQAEKRYPQAVQVLQDVVQRFTRALGAANIQTGMAQVRLGRNLLHEHQYAQAKASSLAGYEILVKQMSPDSAWVAGARHDLAIAYAQLGDRQGASQFASAPAVTEPHRQ